MSVWIGIPEDRFSCVTAHVTAFENSPIFLAINIFNQIKFDLIYISELRRQEQLRREEEVP